MSDVHAEVAFTIRRLAGDEASARVDRLAAIFRDAVLGVGPRHYAAAQVEAWSLSADDSERWHARVRESSTWVASPSDDADHLVGFTLVAPPDHVDMLYVDPAFHRRGIARALLSAIEPEARAAGIDALSADVSLAAYEAFASHGYRLLQWEAVELRTHVFRRARMRKALE